jgi:hypothetical protein
LIFRRFPKKREKAHLSCIPVFPVRTVRENTCVTAASSRVFDYVIMRTLLMFFVR